MLWHTVGLYGLPRRGYRLAWLNPTRRNLFRETLAKAGARRIHGVCVRFPFHWPVRAVARLLGHWWG